MHFLRDLFQYDPGTRALRGHDLIGVGIGARDLDSFVDRLRPLVVSLLKASEEGLVRELGELIRYRLVFLLLPEECLFGDPVEDKPIIRAHLVKLGLPEDEELVRAIKFICTNFRTKRDASVRKTSVSDVYVRSPHIYESILARQGHRCAVCGVQLLYGENMQLDHVLPWHLGDDPTDGSNWQFLCEQCNRGKGMFPYYSFLAAGSNWIRPDQQHRLREDVRYAALVRDRGCVRTGAKPRETELAVVKRVASGCWVLDNVETVIASSAQANL